MPEMTRKDRVLAAAAGKKVDRAPFSLWYHFGIEDPSGASLAEAELSFYKKFRPDFLKVMHDIPYQLPEGMTALESPRDWERLTVLDPHTGNFSRQLEAHSIILQGLGDNPPPVIDTVFSVFAQAQKISGGKTLEHLKQEPEPVLKGLNAIASSLAAYAKACLDAGLSGIFFALGGANTDLMPESQYGQTFLPLDRRVIAGTQGCAEFNVLHIHGANLMFELVSKLPCHALSWSDRTVGPSLGEAKKSFGASVIGGLNEQTVADQSPEEAARDARNALDQTGGRWLMLGPGCAVPTPKTEAEMAAWNARIEAVLRELETYSYRWPIGSTWKFDQPEKLTTDTR
jgi:uroporphyrinogen decarboxylase